MDFQCNTKQKQNLNLIFYAKSYEKLTLLCFKSVERGQIKLKTFYCCDIFSGTDRMPIVSFFQRLTCLFLFTGRSYKLSCVTSIRHDLQLSTRAQFTLTTSIMCRTNVVGLIYMTRSVVKSWRMLVAHDSRKQISCRLNRPLLWRSCSFWEECAQDTVPHRNCLSLKYTGRV